MKFIYVYYKEVLYQKEESILMFFNKTNFIYTTIWKNHFQLNLVQFFSVMESPTPSIPFPEAITRNLNVLKMPSPKQSDPTLERLIRQMASVNMTSAILVSFIRHHQESCFIINTLHISFWIIQEYIFFVLVTIILLSSVCVVAFAHFLKKNCHCWAKQT